MRRRSNLKIYSNIGRLLGNYQDNQSNFMNRTSYNSNINFFNDKIEFTIGIIIGQSKTFIGNPDENLKLIINKFLK
jgi:hypothetical protein